MTEIRTNRDLYLAVATLSKTYAGSSRSLEQYLLALLDLSLRFSSRDGLELSEFYELIHCAFTNKTAEFNDAWYEEYDLLTFRQDDYQGFRATLIRQIVDLREMEENGSLNDDQRYFGIKAPRKSDWYNFDPFGYLECGIEGCFGGWETGDATGRQFVPGPVAVIANDGSIQSANPEDLPHATYHIPKITWEQFKEFLICGQAYE